MRTWAFVMICAVAIYVGAGGYPATHALSPQGSFELNRTGSLPISTAGFEPNRGQMKDHQIQFLARGSDYQVRLAATEATMVFLDGQPRMNTAVTSRTQFMGARADAGLEGEDQLPEQANYLRSPDQRQWQLHVPRYRHVRYHELYPQIDLLYYLNQDVRVEYDFVIHPGGDPEQIQLRFPDAQKLTVDQEGCLVMEVGGRMVRHQKPTVYQEIHGTKRIIEGTYVIRESGHVGFHVAPYAHDVPLMIDPVVLYASYLGGSGREIGYAVAVDKAGNAYVTGQTTSWDFLTTPGTLDTACGADGQCSPDPIFHYLTEDVFVTKVNPVGAVVYSTYIGGRHRDSAWGLTVDAAGNVSLTGTTYSPDFPVTPHAFDSTCGTDGNCNHDGQQPYGDIFFAKLDPTGSKLLYATYLGGSSHDHAYGLATDAAGAAYITGETWSRDYPLLNAVQTTHGGDREDVIITKLDASGAMVYSTYLGGSGGDLGYAVAVDRRGNAYVTGHTPSTDFPVTPGAFQTIFGGGWADIFVAKFSPVGSLIYSTYLGGSGVDWSNMGNIAVDAAGAVYVSGQTQSIDFPTTPGALDATCGTDGLCNSDGQSTYRYGDLFLAKLDPTGALLLSSTYLGGSRTDSNNGLAVDASGTVYLTGSTDSPDFPLTSDAQDATCGTDGLCNFNGSYSLEDAFIVILKPSLQRVEYSTYVGGSATDRGRGIALPVSIAQQRLLRDVFVIGETSSGDFPTVRAFQPLFGGGSSTDAFMMKSRVGLRRAIPVRE